MAALAAQLSLVGAGVSGAYGATLWSQLDPGTTAGTGGSSRANSQNTSNSPGFGNSASVVTYAEDVPCEPAAGPPRVARRRPLHRVRRRPIVRKTVVRKVAAPIVRPYKVVARVHRRRPRVAHVALIAAPKRCVILHSERLNRADLAYAVAPVGAGALDTPAAYAPPGDASQPGFTCGCDQGGGGGGGGGGEPFPGPSGGGGGGGGITPVPTKPPPTSATPEPDTWMLTILAVALCGAALRRARRNAPAEA